jgi:hypothetical protein
MTRIKQDRHKLTVSILQKTADMLLELSMAENRSMTSYLDVLIQDVYDKSTGSDVGLSTSGKGDENKPSHGRG